MCEINKIVELSKKLQEIEVENSRLEWVQYTVGYDFGIEASNKKLNDFMKNKEYFNLIKEHKTLELDKVDKRRIDIVYRAFEPYHKSEEINKLILEIQNKTTELSKILNTFRYKIDGKEKTSVELSQILARSEDRELRKKAYLAKNQINKPMFDGGFLELINMRKELANLNGFDSFVDMKLYEDDLAPEIFSSWKEEVKEILPEMNKIRKAYALKYLGDDTLQPWDDAYVENKIAPSLSKIVDMLDFYTPIHKLFNTFGFDLDEYNITYDIYSRKNKSEWGYNFPIETAKDSRILANVKDRFSEFGVLLHETGHGVHSFLNDPEEIILNRGISGIVTEGIANLFGSLMLDETFYEQFFDDDLEKAKEELTAIAKWRKLNSLRAIPRIMMDQAFYNTDNNSLEDIYNMYWDINKEYLGTTRSDYEPPILFLIHHTTHPIYLHNYLMGDVTCEMLASVFKEKEQVKSISEKPEVFGEFLYREVVKPSGLYAYNDLFKKISGKSFSLSYMK